MAALGLTPFGDTRVFGRPVQKRSRSLPILTSIILIASLLYSITVAAAPARAVATNPTPVCSGAYCTATFAQVNDFYSWTVPAGITSVYVVVQGASGGTGDGTTMNGAFFRTNNVRTPGFGAEMKGDVSVTPGNVLRVQVGGEGTNGLSSYYIGGGGGGGASFISNTSTTPNTPLVVAGGGGGGAGACCGSTITGGVNASLTTSGTAGNVNASSNPGAGGTSGNGGKKGGTNSGAGGGGWLTAGENGQYGGNGGSALISGGAGGAATNASNSLAGGYGGGAASNYGSGGGGGGYSGGGGGSSSSHWGGGGGGGSYSVATSQSNVVRTAYGAGSVSIRYLNAPVPTTFSTTQATPTNSSSAITYSIVMSQNVSGMSNSDFSNSGTATGCSFSINASSGTNFTLTVSSCSEGTIIPQLLADSVLGTVTNTNGPSSNSPTTTSVTRDITAPTISSVTAPSNNTYGPGQNLNFTVNMSEATNVTTTGGTPLLTVTIGSTARSATYRSGTGTSALVFTYTVQTSDLDIDTDGIAIATSLSLNGGAMADPATNTATLSLTAPTLTSVRVAQLPAAPTITGISSGNGSLSVAFTSGAANGSNIITYQYSLNSGGFVNRSATSAASPIDITGLVNGSSYTVAIRAVNSIGIGTASATSASALVNSPQTLSGAATIAANYGTAATSTFTSTGGSAGAKTWTILKSSDGTAVTGITISSVGVVTIASTTLPAAYAMTVRVTDAVGATNTLNTTITVSSITLTVSAATPLDSIYGASRASDTYTVTNLVAGNQVTGVQFLYAGTGSTIYASNTTAPTAAGTYSVTPSNATVVGPGSSAYSNIVYSPAFFTISKKNLVVTPSNTNVVYGTASPVFTPTITGWVFGQDGASAASYVAPSWSASVYSATSAVVVGNFTISCSG